MTRTSRPKTRRGHPERLEQIRFVVWLQKMGIRCHHSPNGGQRHPLEALMFKRMGVSPGFPDIIIPIMSGGYGALFIEMKPEKGGKLRPTQIEWLKYLNDSGYYAKSAEGYEEAKGIVLEYLSLTPKAA